MTIFVKDKKKQFAEESSKTRKAREKLKKQLDALDKHISPQALKKKSIEIHRWIERHAPHRVVIPTKISLFDENQNTAGLSHRVSSLAEQIRCDYPIDTGDSEMKMTKLKKMISRK